MNITLRTLAVFFLSINLVVAQTAQPDHGDTIAPGDNLVVQGVPPIPATLAREIQPYTGGYGSSLAGWGPRGREVLIKGMSDGAWVARVQSPGVEPEMSIDIREPGIYDIYFHPQMRHLAYTRDTGGDEAFQLYLYDAERRTSTRLSGERARSTEPIWSRAGDRIIYSSAPAGSENVSLHLVDPFNPRTDRLLVRSTGSYLKAYDFSPDGRTAVFCDFASMTVSSLWLVDTSSGERMPLSPRTIGTEYYDEPEFSADGRGVYVITDHDSDFRRLAYINLATKRFRYLTSHINSEVEEFSLAPDGRTIAFVTNEEGASRLRLLDTATGQERPVPQTPGSQLPMGLVSNLRWHQNSTDVAFDFSSPRTPGDVYSLDTSTGRIEAWARGTTGGVSPEHLSMPELIRWTSFDRRTISGYMYRPPARFTGRRPVIIDLHGGPADQFRPRFLYEDNYFLNELGVVMIYPNVRGSSGFGKAFRSLDDGRRRPDAVKDVGALLDWIRARPDLDATRVLVRGVSYGGFLALAVAADYSDRIRGAISDSGISNLATFVARTEGWRRELQRAEFGDERDPQARAFMERISPLGNARRISKPLLIFHGQIDPRSPASEAAAIFQATRSRVPVWYVLARNEGHDFVQPENRDFRTFATILFVKEYLLK